MGVHPGFADPRAHPGQDEGLDPMRSPEQPGPPGTSPTTNIDEAR